MFDVSAWQISNLFIKSMSMNNIENTILSYASQFILLKLNNI